MNRSQLLRLAAAGSALLGIVLVPEAIASAAPTSCPAKFLRVVHVHTASGLRAALQHAKAGDQIRLANGIYQGDFTAQHPGTSKAPVVLCGSAKAVLDGGTIHTGYVLHINRAAYTVVSGITIKRGQKGVVLDASPHSTISGVTIHGVGFEGVVFRRNTSDATIKDSHIYDTGRAHASFGEAVYVGSANNHWCDTTSCQPDRCDRVHVVDNAIGPNVRAEAVDIKEGTDGGTVSDNTFDGTGMTAAFSWVDVKGNNWLISHNVGENTRRDGFSDNLAVVGWGNRNSFERNRAEVNAAGYGFRIARGVAAVTVYTNNVVIDAAAGAANVPETSAPSRRALP